MTHLLTRFIPRSLKNRLWPLLDPLGLHWPTRLRSGPAAGLYIYAPLRRARGYAAGTYEPHVLAAIENTLRPGMLALDIGAHLGYFTLVMASLVGPAGQVFAFEPQPAPAAALRRSLSRNRLSRVQVIPLAAGDQTGPAALRRSPNDAMTRIVPLSNQHAPEAGSEPTSPSSRPQTGAEPDAPGQTFPNPVYPVHPVNSSPSPPAFLPPPTSTQSVQSVPERRSLPPSVFPVVNITTLDDWAAAQSLDRLDLLKLDIEGGELAALRGAAGLLERLRPALIIEIHRGPGVPYRPTELAAWLEAHGYQLELLPTHPDANPDLPAALARLEACSPPGESGRGDGGVMHVMHVLARPG